MSELIRMDGQYQTRDGAYRYRVICVDAKGEQPVVALADVDGVEYLRRFNADGVYLPSGLRGSRDLVPVPKKHKRWVNIYANDTWCAYRSREVADRNAGLRRIACKEVEFTEGEGLPAHPAAEVCDVS